VYSYRIWIARCPDWCPRRWHDIPPEGVAMEPAEQRSFPPEEAADFVRGFNLAMLSSAGSYWAVAVPVTVLFDGDLTAGSRIPRQKLIRFPVRASRPRN